ncbi:MAG TPA: acetoacetate decarboxylase family protein [Trichocoleus sp.]|jgi:hypothetical protein
MVAYPSAPWQLQGYAIQTVHLLDIDRIRPLVPSKLEIVPVFPGKTLGGIYLATYQAGSALIYNELIVVTALVSESSKVGGWVSHIYVDNPDSIAGGREIWGLPKELAQFTWQSAPGQNQPLSVQVTQGEDVLCRCRCTWQLPGWQQKLSAPAFSLKEDKLLIFDAHTDSRVQIVGVDLEVPPDSPFGWLKLGHPWLGVAANPLNLRVDAPRVLKEQPQTYSYS